MSTDITVAFLLSGELPFLHLVVTQIFSIEFADV